MVLSLLGLGYVCMKKPTGTSFFGVHRRTFVISAIVLVFVAGIAVALVMWQSGLRGVYRRVAALPDLVRAVLDHRSIQESGRFTNVVFLHHSTGGNLIPQGGVRERLSQAGYAFWDQGYNDQGLNRPDGSATGYSYHVPDDNTDPDGLARVFSQTV